MGKSKNRVNGTPRLDLYNFHYVAGCDIDYYCYTHCDIEGCYNEGVCRCRTIEDARVVMTPDILSLYPKTLSEIDRYCIDRILVNLGSWNPEEYDIRIDRGYYGEEITGIYFLNGATALAKVNYILNETDTTAKINFVLTDEYGYLLDSLIGKTYEVRHVSRDDIFFPQEDHYKRVRLEIEQTYRLPGREVASDDLPRGVVTQEGDRYRVVDGYHRISQIPGQELSVICAINPD